MTKKYSYEKRDELYNVKFIDILQETERGWRVKFDALNPDGVWLPKSRSTFNHDEGYVTIPNWLIEEHGLDVYIIE